MAGIEDLEVWDELTSAEESGFVDSEFGVEKWFPDPDRQNFQKPPLTKRWSEAEPGTVLFDGGVDVRDVNQGALGTCWFVGSLSAVAQHPEIIKHLFLRSESGQNGERGVYGVRLYEACMGGWTKYLLDDAFPVTAGGRLKFTHSTTRSEIWPSVLEKALAKHFGSYQEAAGGNAPVALHMLTGAFVEAYHYRFLRHAATTDLWERLVAAVGGGNVGACAVRPGVDKDETGLVGNHAYGILGCCCLDDSTRLVNMKNPWGHDGEWKGDWGDKSDRWTEEMQSTLGHDPTKNDGVFWIPWETLLKHIDALCIAYIAGPPAAMTQTEVLMNAPAEKGSTRGDRLWLTGKKFRLRNTSEEEEISFFTIMSAPGTQSVIWGFTETGDDLHETLKEENIVIDGCHQGGRINCARTSIPAGGSVVYLLMFDAEKPYVASAVGNGVELEVIEHTPEDFALPVSQAGDGDVFEVPEGWHQSIHAGMWTSFGHGSGPMFGAFQKVWVSFKEPTEVIVLLDQGTGEEEDLHPIQFYIVSSNDWEQSLKKWLVNGMIINKNMEGVQRRSTWNAEPVPLDAGSYCIIPLCNGYLPPEKDSDWSMTVASSVPQSSSFVERPPMPGVKEEILEQFKKYDQNQDGFIDIGELEALFLTLNAEMWSDRDVGCLMKKMDRDANGRVSYGEFVDWIFENPDE